MPSDFVRLLFLALFYAWIIGAIVYDDPRWTQKPIKAVLAFVLVLGFILSVGAVIKARINANKPYDVPSRP